MDGGGKWARRARLLAWVLAAGLVVAGLASMVLRGADGSAGSGFGGPGEGGRYLRPDDGRAGVVAIASPGS